MEITDNDRGKFSIKFETDRHEIDASTYGKVLVNTVILVDEVTNELEGFAQFKLKVTAEKKGSYLTDLTMQAAAVIGVTSSMITPENIFAAKEFASRVVKTLGKVLELAKKLGGEPPKQISQKGDKTVVITGDNNTINIDNSVHNIVLNNNRAQDAIRDIFVPLSDHPEIDGIEILDEKEQPVFESKKADFPKLATRVTKKQEKERTRNVTATLTPVRQSFDRTKKSDFVYAGNRITADITDEAFWNRIEADEAFAKGDKLKVKLEIREQLNQTLNTYERKGYKILEVVEHRPNPNQKLPFDDKKPVASKRNKK